jgi:hypothetical protein
VTGWLPAFITRNFQLKLIAVVVAGGMWVGVVYASDPPAISTFSVHVHSGGVLRPGLVLLRPIDNVEVRVAGVSSQVHAGGVPSHISAVADLSKIKKVGEFEVPLTVVNSDPNVWIWSDPQKVLVVVDSETSRSIPVHITVSAAPPAGYTVDIAHSSITPANVKVQGPESLLANVQAEVSVNLSSVRTSLPIPETVRLTNAQGLSSELTVTPSAVSVVVDIASVSTEAVLPVRATFAGNGEPPTGYTVTGIEVLPLTVTVTGPASTLTALTSISTQPIDLAHVTANETVNVALVTPPGTTLSSGLVSVVITVAPVASVTPTPSPTPSPTP